MSARDVYHQTVRNALSKDGWIITHDPYTFQIGFRNLFVDLGAEWPLAAEREGRKIAIEIKTFGGPSEVRDLEFATGQYLIYRELIAKKEPDRKLYLAINETTYAGILAEPIGQLAIEQFNLALIVFDEYKEVIVKWSE
jgi:hypothetical protein